MVETLYHVTGIGNAIVDILAFVEEDFISRHALPKGKEMLIDQETANLLYDAMPPSQEVSGGSAANTIAGIASFGGRTAFIGKVRDDQLGKIFTHDITALNVHFPTPPSTHGNITGQCFVLVTPDADRTMCAYLGAADALTEADMDEAVLAASEIVYIEGYLFYQKHLYPALDKAIAIAHAYGRKVALTLSDSLCVAHNHAAFAALLAEKKVDILFANEAEITTLFHTDNFEAAAAKAAEACSVAALTRSEKGSVILAGNERYVIEAAPVSQIIDTTGAGDLYASGFLHGLAEGKALPECGRLGSLAAAEVISHLGARPEISLKSLVA